MGALRLVVGLGNPGPRYERTRHNVGFMVLDRLAGEAAWKDFEGGLVARAEGLILGRPLTYMNESGRFVGALSRFYKIAPEEILVCFDDVALPLGRVRLRPSGSAGGQKGMASVIAHLGDKVPRLRLGIGPQPQGMKSEDFVLSPFAKAEQEALSEVLDRACDAVRLAASEGLEAAMNKFNKEHEPSA